MIKALGWVRDGRDLHPAAGPDDDVTIAGVVKRGSLKCGSHSNTRLTQSPVIHTQEKDNKLKGGRQEPLPCVRGIYRSFGKYSTENYDALKNK